MMTIDGQLDIFELLTDGELVPTEVVLGAGSFMFPGDFEAMYNQKKAWHAEYHVDKGNWRPYRGWTSNQFDGKDSAHLAESFDADLRCQHSRRRECSCVGSLVYRVYCHGCGHWTGIHADENLAWEEHLDHCWPGWRDLPVLESKQVGYGYKWDIPADYPTPFQQPGAPIRDCRGSGPFAGRHVPRSNQFGGLKVAVFQDCKQHNQKSDK